MVNRHLYIRLISIIHQLISMKYKIKLLYNSLLAHSEWLSLRNKMKTDTGDGMGKEKIYSP